jgi:hypothetical protein
LTPKLNEPLKIYELHPSLFSDERIDSGKQPTFKSIIKFIQYIKDAGYNAVQIMGISEHMCYESFGYHVTNPYAITNRFGGPKMFKLLVSELHRSDLIVLIDIVHAHAANDSHPGLKDHGINDSSSEIYFTNSFTELGSRHYNYADHNVMIYLLSNLKWMIEEYQIDGFRFSAINDIIYNDENSEHSEHIDQSDRSYPNYININGLAYLIMANELIHSYPNKLTIAKDYSEQQVLNVGFDFRQRTEIAEYLQSIIESFNDQITELEKKETPIEQIVKDNYEVKKSLFPFSRRRQERIELEKKHNEPIILTTTKKDLLIDLIKSIDPNDLVHKLTNHRVDEKFINCVESHDQQILGHKTFIHNMLGNLIHTDMVKINDIETKTLRIKDVYEFVTIAMNFLLTLRELSWITQQGGTMTFAGNEFMHPNSFELPNKDKMNNVFKSKMWKLIIDRYSPLDHNKSLRFYDSLQTEKSMNAHSGLFDKSFCNVYNHKTRIIELTNDRYYCLINFSNDKVIDHPTHLIFVPTLNVSKFILNVVYSRSHNEMILDQIGDQIHIKKIDPMSTYIFEIGDLTGLKINQNVRSSELTARDNSI